MLSTFTATGCTPLCIALYTVANPPLPSRQSLPSGRFMIWMSAAGKGEGQQGPFPCHQQSAGGKNRQVRHVTDSKQPWRSHRRSCKCWHSYQRQRHCRPAPCGSICQSGRICCNSRSVNNGSASAPSLLPPPILSLVRSRAPLVDPLGGERGALDPLRTERGALEPEDGSCRVPSCAKRVPLCGGSDGGCSASCTDWHNRTALGKPGE